MNLRSLTIQPEYRSDRVHLIEDFYLPCLEHTVLYCRAVGFFSSTSLVAISQGLTALIRAGGKMQVIASPHLSVEDVEAMQKGLRKREEVITQVILQELEREFATVAQDRLACLGWLLGQGFLEIKLAVSQNIEKQGIYHEKLGIFSDNFGNTIAFTGSANESYSALIQNFECIDVFCSWKTKEQERVARKWQHFQKLWQNQTEKVEVMDFPEAAARSLLRFRPVSPPTQEPELTFKKHVAEISGDYRTDLKITLHSRQEQALQAWKKAQNRGILAMATGSGKTVTALAGAIGLPQLDFILIGVPTRELVQQWAKEIEKQTYYKIPLLGIGESEPWREKLFRKLRLLNHRQLSPHKHPVIVIGTYSELSKSPIASLIEDAGGLPPYSLLIADEVHATGTGIFRRVLREDFTYRLGLSATPLRPYDEEGTEVILDYFGGIVYEFGLEDAIAQGILCQYDYYPYITYLNAREHAKFKELTHKIRKVLSKVGNSDDSKTKQLKIQRSRLIKSAASKLDILTRILTDHPLQKAMVYCADIQQATQISQILASKGFCVARYSSVDRDRHQLLSQLARGELDALVAVKCLDEGVDIPAVHQGIILASDASQRQFIQRRGRILRVAPRKEIAILIDVLVVPPSSDEPVKLIESELQRIIQFARHARNRTSTITQLAEELRDYGITYADLL